MSTTKEKILEESIKLFNEKGCLQTSTRHIATKVEISVGNLYYYFKNKEEIVLCLYERYMHLINLQLTSLDEEIDEAFDYYEFLIKQMDYELKFRFFRLELNNIFQKFPKVRKAMEDSIKLKQKQIGFVFKHQIKYEYIKPLSKEELEFVVSNTWIIVAKWEVYWILDKVNDELQRRKRGILNFLYFIKPYLTQKGLKETKLLESIQYLQKGINNENGL